MRPRLGSGLARHRQGVGGAGNGPLLGRPGWCLPLCINSGSAWAAVPVTASESPALPPLRLALRFTLRGRGRRVAGTRALCLPSLRNLNSDGA